MFVPSTVIHPYRSGFFCEREESFARTISSSSLYCFCSASPMSEESARFAMVSLMLAMDEFSASSARYETSPSSGLKASAELTVNPPEKNSASSCL